MKKKNLQSFLILLGFELALIFVPFLMGNLIYFFFGDILYSYEKVRRLIYLNILASIYLRYITYGPFFYFLVSLLLWNNRFFVLFLTFSYFIHFIYIYPFNLSDFVVINDPVLGFPFHWIISLIIICCGFQVLKYKTQS